MPPAMYPGTRFRSCGRCRSRSTYLSARPRRHSSVVRHAVRSETRGGAGRPRRAPLGSPPQRAPRRVRTGQRPPTHPDLARRAVAEARTPGFSWLGALPRRFRACALRVCSGARPARGPARGAGACAIIAGRRNARAAPRTSLLCKMVVHIAPLLSGLRNVCLQPFKCEHLARNAPGRVPAHVGLLI
jgi:hypothetical protein